MNYFKKTHGFAILVVALSCFNLFNCFHRFAFLSALVSLSGITGAILFWKGRSISNKFMLAWVYLQCIIIEPVFDVSQVYTWMIGSWATLRSGTEVGIGVNVIGLAYLFLFKLATISSLEKRKVQINRFREDNRLGDVFPINGIGVRRVKFFNEKTWLLVLLEKELVYRDLPYTFVIIKAKQGSPQKEMAEQISDIRLIQDPAMLEKNNYDGADFPFIDWVSINID
jgi:hypothetical protein